MDTCSETWWTLFGMTLLGKIMPWREASLMALRLEFVQLASQEDANVPVADQGHQHAMLSAAIRFAERQRSRALIVMQDGRVLAEHYWANSGARTAEAITSASKSIVSLLIGMCLTRGAIRDVDQPAADFVIEWRGTPHEAIRIRHLLSMTSGLRNVALWRVALPETSTTPSELDLLRAPGTLWEYNTPAYRVLFIIIERATGQSLHDFTQQNLFDPLGMRDSIWQSRTVKGTRQYQYVLSSARDMAAFGQLVLQRGEWSGCQLVNAAYVDEALQPQLNPSYGYLFWLNRAPRRMFAEAPPECVAALGAHHTCIFIIRSHRLVITRLGESADLPGERLGRRAGNPNTFYSILVKTILQQTAIEHRVGA